MTAPFQLRDETLRDLRRTRDDMAKAKWILSVKKQPPDVRREAALKRLDVEEAILALVNAKLDNIRDALVANETDLVESRKALEAARERLERVANVLGKVGRVLGVLGRIVAL